MTPRQQIAVDHTCRLPEECVHPRFARVILPFGTILTLNSGFE